MDKMIAIAEKNAIEPIIVITKSPESAKEVEDRIKTAFRMV